MPISNTQNYKGLQRTERLMLYELRRSLDHIEAGTSRFS